jgi:hypothetical protein
MCEIWRDRFVHLCGFPFMTDEASIICGTVDRNGRLISADSRLLALQIAAGGEADGVIAVPQLASLVRLVRSLGVVVSRGIVAADGDATLDLWVRAQPEGDMIRLAIAGWTERPISHTTDADLAARARDLATIGGDGHWSTDKSLRLIEVDAQLQRALPDDWQGQRLMRLMEIDRDDRGDYPIHDAVLDGVAFSGQHARIKEKPEVQIWLHGAPKVDAEGAITGFAGGYRWASVPHDFLVEQEPVGSSDPQFVTRLDGALRKPLSRIIANADEIAAQGDGPLKADYVSYAGDIAAAGRHLLGLVDDLSDLQAVERPGFAVEAERLDLADVARRAASLLGVRAADSRVRIDAPDMDEPLWAKADFRRTLQIMVNLVGNAVRYSPEGSSVWIRAEQEGDIAALIVADQGKGIAEADQDRIFEKFERVDPSEPGGSGLGLYISRRLARAMGGDLAVDSALGLGARFVLTLPAASASLPD